MDPDEALVALRDCAQDLTNGTDEYSYAETAHRWWSCSRHWTTGWPVVATCRRSGVE